MSSAEELTTQEAVVYTYDGFKKKEIRKLREVSRGHIIVEVVEFSVCGSDIPFTKGEVTPYDALGNTAHGHEVYGKVIAVGDGVTSTEIGDIVALESHVPADESIRAETPWHEVPKGNHGVIGYMPGITPDGKPGTTVSGGFCEYIHVPESNAYKVPEKVLKRLNEHASLLEPNGNAIYAALTIRNHLLEQQIELKQAKVVIVGLGPQGRMLAAILKHYGIGEIVGLDIDKLRVLEVKQANINIHAIVDDRNPNISTHIETTLGGKADVVFDASGANGIINNAARYIMPDGVFFAFGLRDGNRIVPGQDNDGLTLKQLIVGELSTQLTIKGTNFEIKGLFGRSLESWEEIIALLADDEVGPILAAAILENIRVVTNIEEFVQLLNNYDPRAGKLIMSFIKLVHSQNS